MGEEKIAGFYDDPIKVACDSYSASRASYVRAISLDPGLPWRARRWGKFIGQLAAGRFRQARRQVRRPSGQNADVGSAAPAKTGFMMSKAAQRDFT